jgi:hypothetical protein
MINDRFEALHYQKVRDILFNEIGLVEAEFINTKYQGLCGSVKARYTVIYYKFTCPLVLYH